MYKSIDNFHQTIDIYSVENNAEFTQQKIGLKTFKNPSKKRYETSEHTKILSMPKCSYDGKDFF